MTTVLRGLWHCAQGVLPHAVWLGLVLFALVVAPRQVAAQPPPSGSPLRPGDMVVVTHDHRLPNPAVFRDVGTLVKVDSSSGAETTLSDFADPGQGPVSGTPGLEPPWFFAALLTQDAAGVVVRHSRFDGTFHVDPATGVRTIISNLFASAIESSGDLLVLGQSALIRVNRLTGTQTTVSDFLDPAQGPIAERISAVAVEKSGQIIVGGSDVLSRAVGLFRVDPSTGVRTVLSDFGNPAQGPTLSATGPGSLSGHRFEHLLIDHSDEILLVTRHFFSGGFPFYRVNPLTGTRVLVSESVCGVCQPGARSPGR